MKRYSTLVLLLLLLSTLCTAIADELAVNDNIDSDELLFAEDTMNGEYTSQESVADLDVELFEQDDVPEKQSEAFRSAITIVLGFISGIIASLLSWLVIKRIQPKIEISDKILLIPSVYNDGEIIPKIKIENKSRYDAFEVDLRGRIFMFGLVKENPDTPRLFIVNVGGNAPHPYLPSKKESAKNIISGREFRLHMNKATRKKMAEKLFKYEQEKEPTLADCLERDHRNYIEVSVFSSHAFSFTRGILKHIYKLDDITEGYFNNHGVTVQKSPSKEHRYQEIDSDTEDIKDLGK